MALASQEQFEQAYSDMTGEAIATIMASRLSNCSYDNPKIATAYRWWRKSRAAVVVVLPKPDADAGWSSAIKHCQAAIEAAGMQVRLAHAN